MVLRIFALVMFCCASIGFVFFGFSQTGFAQDAETGEEKPVAEASKDELLKKQTSALRTQVKDTMNNLDVNDAQHFAVMYSNYMIYSAVKAVREDVGGAVDQCSENNPDMAKDINSRYEAWNKNVGDMMEEADSNLNNMALSQTYMSQEEVKTLFGLVDETRRANSSRFETTPVTTPEACEFMLSKMDETEESMKHMLQATLVSYPTLLKKNQK